MASLTPSLGEHMLLGVAVLTHTAAQAFFVCDLVQSPVRAVACSLSSLFKLPHASDSLTKQWEITWKVPIL